MTRINCVPVSVLSREHLVAEYREMLRLSHRHIKQEKPNRIPDSYRLGTGHVMFFIDKGKYLLNRHKELREEMLNRGYTVNYELDLSHWPDWAMKDWEPTKEAIQENWYRIVQRGNGYYA